MARVLTARVPTHPLGSHLIPEGKMPIMLTLTLESDFGEQVKMPTYECCVKLPVCRG